MARVRECWRAFFWWRGVLFRVCLPSHPVMEDITEMDGCEDRMRTYFHSCLQMTDVFFFMFLLTSFFLKWTNVEGFPTSAIFTEMFMSSGSTSSAVLCHINTWYAAKQSQVTGWFRKALLSVMDHRCTIKACSVCNCSLRFFQSTVRVLGKLQSWPSMGIH